jgi:DNA-binding GntR family transcriptional regulator
MDDPRKWVQITNELRDRISSGELEPGKSVYVVLESQARGVGKETVRKAVRVLEGEGLLKRVPGYGYFVIDRGKRL